MTLFEAFGTNSERGGSHNIACKQEDVVRAPWREQNAVKLVGNTKNMKEGGRSAQAVNVAFEQASLRLQSSPDETHLTDMKDE